MDANKYDIFTQGILLILMKECKSCMKNNVIQGYKMKCPLQVGKNKQCSNDEELFTVSFTQKLTMKRAKISC